MNAPSVDGLLIGQVLARTAARLGDHEGVVFPLAGYRRSWRAFYDEVTEVARAFIALGVQPGDHVAIWATNVPQWVLLQFATARVGAVLVNINPAYRPFELEYVLHQSDSSVLFLVDAYKTSDYFSMLAEVCPQIGHNCESIDCERFPKLKRVVSIQGEQPPGVTGWKQFLEGAKQIAPSQVDAIEDQLKPTQAINIQYTSGTTGFPKAAMLSHRSLLLNAYYVAQRQRLTENDRLCIPVPFYHCFGCVLGTLGCVVSGATMVIPNFYFKAKETLDAIESERCTALYGVPTMFIAQLEDPSFAGRDLSSLRTGIMSGAPCPIEIMRRVGKEMNLREITIAYGQTEASPVITQTDCSDPIELRVETVGNPLPCWEVKVVDPATGEQIDDGQPGELCARGDGVMLGYYKNAEATAAAIDHEGWLHTGDLAVRLPKGYYKITGRLKDMVIRGGENIYPREIEEFLYTHPAIEQSAVVGVPDRKYGEELCAWVKLKSGAGATTDEIRELCKRSLAHYKVPKYIKFVEMFPQTVTGKIQKFKIREAMIAELALEVHETA